MTRETLRSALVRASAVGVDATLEALRRENPEAVREQLRKFAAKGDSVCVAVWAQLFPGEPIVAGSEVRPAVGMRSLPARTVLSNPGPFLSVVSDDGSSEVQLGSAFVLQSWAIVGLAALARRERTGHLELRDEAGNRALDFARALGLNEVVEGVAPPARVEAGRTIPLQRLRPGEKYEPLAERIARLIAPENDDARMTLYYVLVELLRNAQQHSLDPLGAVVGAQRMTGDQQYARDVVQVTVADTGIGILEALRGMHVELELKEPAAAIEKALLPHISGTFAEGQTGSDRNAGFGLFVISELTKLTGGRLLIASRGASLLIQADATSPTRHQTQIIGPSGVGFPGVLVAFEFPLDDVPRFDRLMEEIKQRAATQTPQRTIHHWIRYEGIPEKAEAILVKLASEDIVAAEKVAKALRVRLLGGDPILLDFSGLSFVTQSFLHALLYRVLRLAWAEQHPVFVRNAVPAVRSAIDTFERYALSG